MNRYPKDYLIIALKGLGMGAADIVPGVSGGTIAFISGIYEELIHSLKSFNGHALKALKTNGISGFWQHVNGSFLLALFGGIGISIISLAKVLHHFLEQYPQLLWAFFFGLIVASAIIIAKKITKWKLSIISGLLFGTAIAYAITVLSPAETSISTWFIFLSGMIAICAMILPGISGSFILLLMGKYAFIVGALSDLKIEIIAIFSLGCATGLLSFSHLLSWMLRKHHDLTIAVLTGFMIGSLNKVWPWKETLTVRINSKGMEVPVIQENVMPGNYGGEPYLVIAITLALTGFLLIYLLEKYARKIIPKPPHE